MCERPSMCSAPTMISTQLCQVPGTGVHRSGTSELGLGVHGCVGGGVAASQALQNLIVGRRD